MSDVFVFFLSSCFIQSCCGHLQVIKQLAALCYYLQHYSTAVRHMAARVLATLGVKRTPEVLTHVIEHVLPALGATHNLHMRQGACEAIASILSLSLN